VLGLVTSEFLYRAHPSEHEGQLTKTKSLLVSKAILSRRALAMGLGRFVLMSHSEVESGGRQRLSILADAFESVVGAIYLDQGFESSRAFIERWLLRESRTIAADKRHTNYKSHLQEYVQSTFRTHPVYRIRSEMGPDHSKQFSVEVIVGRRVLGEGKGRNKKEAEQAAARDALDRVGGPSDESRSRRRIESTRPETAVPEGMHDEDSDDDLTTDVAEVTDEVEGDARPRRRGRRGGRGRRRNGVESGPSEAAAPPPPPPPMRTAPVASPVERKPKPEPRRTPLLFRRDVEHEPRVERPVELEPPPRSYDEDELEEVGRPEGPHEELHVDPYAWEGGAARPHVTDESTEEAPAVERGRARAELSHDHAERSNEPAEWSSGPAEHSSERYEHSSEFAEHSSEPAEYSNEPESMTIERGTEATHETDTRKRFEPEPTREPEADRESETAPEEEESWLDRTRPATPEPPTTPPAPHYGRRPGRSRR